LPQSHQGGLLRHHHPGLCPGHVAGVSAQRDHARRYQRTDRFQESAGPGSYRNVHQAGPLRDRLLRPAGRLLSVPLPGALQTRQAAAGHPRRRESTAFHRLPDHPLQDFRVRRSQHAGRAGWNALRTADRHHHARAHGRAGVDRDRRLDRRRRPGYAGGCHGRCRAHQPALQLFDGYVPRHLALLPGRPLHRRRAVFSRGDRRDGRASQEQRDKAGV
ncbi:uncharacterized protein METZ01_LOCUS484521, partial [marine metagenome]